MPWAPPGLEALRPCDNSSSKALGACGFLHVCRRRPTVPASGLLAWTGSRRTGVGSGSSQLSPAALLPRRGEEELGTSSLCALLLASSAALRVDWQTAREDSGIQSCTGSVREAFCVCGKSREADISVVGRALCYKVFETPFADWGESWRRQQECCQPSAKC